MMSWKAPRGHVYVGHNA